MLHTLSERAVTVQMPLGYARGSTTRLMISRIDDGRSLHELLNAAAAARTLGDDEEWLPAGRIEHVSEAGDNDPQWQFVPDPASTLIIPVWVVERGSFLEGEALHLWIDLPLSADLQQALAGECLLGVGAGTLHDAGSWPHALPPEVRWVWEAV